MNKLKKILIYTLNVPLYLIAKIIPKDDKIWIFGAWFGDKYADNSKYLFEYINENHPKIRAIWLTRNKDAYELVKAKGYEVYYTYSLKSILLGLRTKCSIFVQLNNVDNIPFLNNNRTLQIQLWHGTPLKKIGLDDTLHKYRRLKIKYIIFPFLEQKFDYMITQSNEDKKNFKAAFNVKKISITGYPRNDSLFKFKKIRKDKFNILYLPTFRGKIGSEIDLLTDYGFNYLEYNKWLGENNSLLYLKMHPVNKPSAGVVSKVKNYKNIKFLEEIDVAEILPQADILIIDYSSVYFDYLLTDKPIIFAPFDYERYITKDREFYYDYNKVTPGPKCKDWNEVLEWIEKFKNDPTLYLEERKIIKDKFHKYQDGNSCERVYNEIVKLVNG